MFLPAPCSCSVKRKDSRRSAKTGHYLQMSFFPPIFASIFLPLSTTILLLYFCEEYFETFLSRILGELSPDVLLPPHLCLDISYKSLFLFHRLSSILFVQNIFRILLTFLARIFWHLCSEYFQNIFDLFGQRFRFSQNISPSFVCDLHIWDYSNLFRPNKFWLLG